MPLPDKEEEDEDDMSASEPITSAAVVLTATARAPTFSDVLESCGDLGIPERRHRKVSCSRKADVPARGINIGLQGGHSVMR